MQLTNSWIEEGILKGKLEGQAEGRMEAMRESLAVLLVRLFGERATDLIQRLPDCDLDCLCRLQEQLRSGAELEQLTLE